MSVWRRLKQEDKGVSAIIVAICLVVIFGAAVISIDTGQLWAARRNMVTGTDAAALSEARAQGLKHTPLASTCTNTWLTILNANVGNLSETPQCKLTSVSNDGTSGIVIVSGRKKSPALFSGALGIGDSAAFSATAAQWGTAIAVTGIRPIALCTYDTHVEDGLLLHGTTSETHISGTPAGDYSAPDGSTDYANRTPGTVHHIAFTSSCNGAPGNFGWVDLNTFGDAHTPPESCSGACNSNDSKETADWLTNGYYGNMVTLSSPSDCDASAPGTQGCTGDPGVSNSKTIKDAMDYLVNPTSPGNCTMGAGGNCKPLAIPVILYDGVTGGGNGAPFHLVGVAYVKIFNYGLANGNRFLDLEFSFGLFDGTCCARTPGAGNGNAPPVPVIKICDVDHDPADPGLTGAGCTFS